MKKFIYTGQISDGSDDRIYVTHLIVPPSVREISCYNRSLSYSSVVHIELNEGLERIGCQAFLSCISLTRIVIPSTVRYIDNEAFSHCSKLEHVELNEAHWKTFAFHPLPSRSDGRHSHVAIVWPI